jgi:type I restriction enzyme S subunit
LSLEQFVNQTKSKVLELAIKGKLVPQNPEDEPASTLLERLGKNDKIKKASDKSHYPFEIPTCWTWCKLGEIGDWRSGATPSRVNKNYYKNGDIYWLKTGDLTDGYIYEIPEKITQKALLETSVKLNPIGSVLIAMYGATIGKVGILTQPATTNQACCACSNFKGIDNLFLFYLLIAYRDYFVNLGEGGAQPNISKEKITSTDIPLPPLAEQERIVSQIEKIFAQLEIIENSLKA